MAHRWNHQKGDKKVSNRFTAVKDFFSDELQSGYVAGMSYEAQDHDEKLLELIPKWLKEGKIKENGADAIVSGTAEVTNKE